MGREKSTKIAELILHDIQINTKFELSKYEVLIFDGA